MAIFIAAVLCFNAYAQDIIYADSIINTDILNLHNNTTVSETAIINANQINIQNSIRLKNHGTINSDIFIADGYVLALDNSGTINGDIYIGDNSRLIQVIKTREDITRLNVNGSGFSILVHNKEPLRLSDIKAIAYGADRIILENAAIIFEPIRPMRMMMLYRAPPPPALELKGEVLLEIDNHSDLDGTLLLQNISGDGVVNLHVKGLDPLYVAMAVRRDDDIYLKIKRETDYQKIFDVPTGRFINYLRDSDSQNKTVLAMDRAATMSELQGVAARSVSLNPINLTRPISVFNNFEMDPYESFATSPELSLEPIYISSNGTSMEVAKASIIIPYDDVNIRASGYIGSFESYDDINEFSGQMYGGNISANIDLNSLWIDATVGFTKSSFITDPIFDGNNVTYNPDGLSLYGASDVGMKFNIDDDIYVSPFAGVAADFNSVLHQSDLNITGRAGGIAGYKSETMGLRYDYQIFAMFETDVSASAGIRMNFWSVADGVGGGFSYALSHDEFGISHKISAELNFEF